MTMITSKSCYRILQVSIQVQEVRQALNATSTSAAWRVGHQYLPEPQRKYDIFTIIPQLSWIAGLSQRDPTKVSGIWDELPHYDTHDVLQHGTTSKGQPNRLRRPQARTGVTNARK